MTWKKHPGIFFTLYSIESIFLMSLMFGITEFVPEIIERSIVFFWSSMMFFGMISYHTKWIEKLFEKQIKKDKTNGSGV